jgi:hypothetical protein
MRKWINTLIACSFIRQSFNLQWNQKIVVLLAPSERRLWTTKIMMEADVSRNS